MKTPLHHLRQESPLGTVWLSATDRGLAGLWFLDQRHAPAWLGTGLPESPTHPVLVRTAEQIRAYFVGRRRDFDLPLDLEAMGTPFQQSVWRALCNIPCGETVSYGELGRRIGRASAVRAVGAAVGRNPVSIIVPCHRVVGANGSLTGYAGGLHRKAALLKLETRP